MELYFKVYQDKLSTGEGYDFYVTTLEEVLKICNDKNLITNEENAPVFEPVYMKKNEYESLPEFTGF